MMNEKIQNIFLITFLCILSASLRYPLIEQGSIWLDEAWRINASQIHLDSNITILVNQLMSYEGLLRLAGHWIGNSEWSYRIPSTLSGIFSVPALFYLGLILTKNKKISFIAAVLLALNPWHITYSIEAASYSIGAFLVVLLFINIIRLYESNKNIYLLFSLIISSILSLLHLYLFGLSILIIFLLLLSDWRNNSFRKKVLLLAIIIISINLFQFINYARYLGTDNVGLGVGLGWALGFPVIALNALMSGPIFDRFTPTAYSIFLEYRVVLSVLIITGSVIFVFSLFKRWKDFNREIKYVSITILLYIGFIYLQAFIAHGAFLRYLIPVVPVLILVITMTMGLGEQRNKKIINVLLVFFVANYLVVINADPPSKKNRPEWKNLYKELSSKCANDFTYVIVPSWAELTIAKFYLNKTSCQIITQPSFYQYFIKHDKSLTYQGEKEEKIEDIYLSNKITEVFENNSNSVFYIIANRSKNRINSIVKQGKFKAEDIFIKHLPEIIIKEVKSNL
jgi:uncharacterized membrane protein